MVVGVVVVVIRLVRLCLLSLCCCLINWVFCMCVVELVIDEVFGNILEAGHFY